MGASKRTATRRKRPLSRERILRAALALADRDGIAAVTMRRVAGRLGVEAMSLYNHVQNKDDLVDGIIDLVVSEIELPKPGGDWRDAMRRRAVSTHDVLLRHPWAAQLVGSRPSPGPAMLRYVDATLACLVEAGFSYALADHAWNAMDNHIYGFTVQELRFPFEPDEYAEVAKASLDLIPAEQYPHLRALAQEVISGRHSGLHDFTLGLDLILDGLERLRAPGG